MRSDIVPGTVFPDYELPDQTATRRKLSELQGPHPMVLVLRELFYPYGKTFVQTLGEQD